MLGLFDEKLLFNDGKKEITHFDLPDAELTLREQFFEKKESDFFYAALLQQTPWQQRLRKMYDKMVPDPRLTAWYGKKAGNAWTPELLSIKNKIEETCGIQFDSVLLNYYRNGKDSVSWHSDTKPASGIYYPIASVSFGETRSFQVRHKSNKEIGPFSIPLMHGSFLLMGATMQDFYEHHIAKTTKQIAPRINLTFRIDDTQ